MKKIRVLILVKIEQLCKPNRLINFLDLLNLIKIYKFFFK